MSHKNTANNNDYQYQFIVAGDLLLHSEVKLIPIKIIVQSLIITSPVLHRPNISRIIPCKSGVINNQTNILCDLKNPTIINLNPKRRLSSRKIVHMHKTDWSFVKELKTKIIKISNTPSKKIDNQ